MRWTADARGAAAVEFALVAPVFLTMLFLLLDGGRMLYAKQAVNQLAAATARCAAIKATGCTTATDAQSWAVTRGLTRQMIAVTAGVTLITTAQAGKCGSYANMAQATISMTYRKGAMNLLPQSATPSVLRSVSCFPIASG